MCFSNPNSKVLTSKGWIPISHVKENDLVLTHSGKFSRVSKYGSYIADGFVVSSEARQQIMF